jgi:hypothetical protein
MNPNHAIQLFKAKVESRMKKQKEQHRAGFSFAQAQSAFSRLSRFQMQDQG